MTLRTIFGWTLFPFSSNSFALNFGVLNLGFFLYLSNYYSFFSLCQFFELSFLRYWLQSVFILVSSYHVPNCASRNVQHFTDVFIGFSFCMMKYDELSLFECCVFTFSSHVAEDKNTNRQRGELTNTVRYIPQVNKWSGRILKLWPLVTLNRNIFLIHLHGSSKLCVFDIIAVLSTSTSFFILFFIFIKFCGII